MTVICINLNYLNNVNGKVPGRRWETFDPEVDKVYNVLEVETYQGLDYYKLEGCSVLWLYESTSFSQLVSDEVLEKELESVLETIYD